MFAHQTTTSLATVPMGNLTAVDTGAITFQTGSTCATDADSTATSMGYAFGNTGNVGTVVFSSGATYYHGGLKDLTPSLSTPSNPFGLSAPSSKVTWNAGSTYVQVNSGSPSLSNRTYANYTQAGNVTGTLGGGSPFTVNGNFRLLNGGNFNLGSTAGAVTVTGNFIIDSGTSGAFTDTTSAAPVAFSIGGNISIGSAARFIPGANRTYVLNGLSAQTANFAGDTLSSVTVNNASGVSLSTGGLTVGSLLTLTTGVLNSNGQTLTAPEPEAGIARASGYVAGTLTRVYNAANTTTRTFPVGTANGYSP